MRIKKYDEQGKQRRRHAEDSPSSSESSDDENEEQYTQERSNIFWNERSIAEMQQDEENLSREYIRITVTRTVDKVDQDFVQVEADIAKWPDKAVEYQYIMQCLNLR